MNSKKAATLMTKRAPCGACDACEHCPFPDCTWDGVTRAEWAAAKAEDASARHFGESKVAAQHRAYREANREKLAAQQRAYYEANREKLAAQQRAYYEANREKLAAYKRAYYEKHKEQILEAQRQRRARKRAELECEHRSSTPARNRKSPPSSPWEACQ